MDESDRKVNFDSVFEEGDSIDKSLVAADRRSVARHKALGQSIVVFRDGKPQRLSPEEINLDDFSAPGSFTTS
jgi:hypothetical protein